MTTSGTRTLSTIGAAAALVDSYGCVDMSGGRRGHLFADHDGAQAAGWVEPGPITRRKRIDPARRT